MKVFKLSDNVHTYSIVAVDSENGWLGGAVQSHYFSVGSVVLWGEPGVGMVATQSVVNPAFGPNGLDALKQGKTPAETVEKLKNSDAGIDHRQCGIVDIYGHAAAFTGTKCIPFADHVTGNGYSAQANMMRNEGVPEAMADAFTTTAGNNLSAENAPTEKGAVSAGSADMFAERLAALLAAEKALMKHALSSKKSTLRIPLGGN